MAERARTGGARGAGTAISTWLERHAHSLVASLGRLVRAPFGTLLTVGVIAVALALPAGLHLLVTNARALSGGWERTLDFTVYLETEVAETAARQLAERVSVRPEVHSVRLVTAAEGLAEFREWSGLGAALDALGENPLPAALVVSPRVDVGAADPYAAVGVLAGELRTLPGVAQVQIDAAWLLRLDAVLDALRRAVTIAAVVLAAAVLMIVGNTIRLDIDRRRAEIEVTKLVGGSDGFVRRPFLYGGFWYGLAGGLLAWLLVGLVIAALDGPVARIGQAYGSAFRLGGLDATATAWLIGGGAVLGWLGAWVSATRHLRAIEPGGESA